jgi:hypothetical protein
MTRFAVLTHDHPYLHWDLLLEHGEACRTWRLPMTPDAPGELSAEAIADHRLMYLDYEGPVGTDRGSVSQWDSGTFQWLVCSDDYCAIRVHGHKLNGTVQLVRSDGDRWEYDFERD